MSLPAEQLHYPHMRWDALNVTEDEKLIVMLADIRDYMYKCEQWNDEPTINEFLRRHGEWNFDRYNDIIEAEFKRIQELT